MMFRKTIAQCEECKTLLIEGEKTYCKDCWVEMEELVEALELRNAELEEEVEQLKTLVKELRNGQEEQCCV